MVGKASLLLVLGFSMILLVFGHNFNDISTRTVDNFVDYYSKTVSHDLANSGADLAANAIFLDNNWTTGYSNLQMNGGKVNVSVGIVDASQNIRKIVSISNYENEADTVEVIIAPSRFSQYAYYSESEGGNIWWTGKDTVYGPFHTQDDLRADSHPVFGVGGYRTTYKGKLIYKNNYNSDKPEFHGSYGYDDVPLQTDGLDPLRDAAADNGFKIDKSISTTLDSTWVNPTYNYWQHKWNPGYWNVSTTTGLDTVYVTFVQDSVRIKMGYNKTESTYKSSEIAPNGVIYAQGMDVRLKGTVKGQFSVLSDGNVYLDDDVVYNTQPSSDPHAQTNSTDLLGILSQNNVYITDNNNTVDIKIDAAIYCETGGFGAENYDSRSVDGDINLLGGVTQHIRRAVGTYASSWGNILSIKSGYNKKYKYDDRLKKMYPPFFPVAGGFQILSWKE